MGRGSGLRSRLLLRLLPGLRCRDFFKRGSTPDVKVTRIVSPKDAVSVRGKLRAVEPLTTSAKGSQSKLLLPTFGIKQFYGFETIAGDDESFAVCRKVCRVHAHQHTAEGRDLLPARGIPHPRVAHIAGNNE